VKRPGEGLHRGTIDLYDPGERAAAGSRAIISVRQLSLASEEAACAAYLAKYIWRPYRQRDSLFLSFAGEVVHQSDGASADASRGFGRDGRARLKKICHPPGGKTIASRAMMIAGVR